MILQLTSDYSTLLVSALLLRHADWLIGLGWVLYIEGFLPASLLRVQQSIYRTCL